MTREADNPMTGCDFDWMVSNHAVWGWKAPVKASVSGVSLLQLSPFFASIFPLFPQKRLILRLVLLLSFDKFATYLQRANLCKSIFSSSETCVKFRHFAELYLLNKSPSNLAPLLISRRSFQPS